MRHLFTVLAFSIFSLGVFEARAAEKTKVTISDTERLKVFRDSLVAITPGVTAIEAANLKEDKIESRLKARMELLVDALVVGRAHLTSYRKTALLSAVYEGAPTEKQKELDQDFIDKLNNQNNAQLRDDTIKALKELYRALWEGVEGPLAKKIKAILARFIGESGLNEFLAEFKEKPATGSSTTLPGPAPREEHHEAPKNADGARRLPRDGG